MSQAFIPRHFNEEQGRLFRALYELQQNWGPLALAKQEADVAPLQREAAELLPKAMMAKQGDAAEPALAVARRLNEISMQLENMRCDMAATARIFTQATEALLNSQKAIDPQPYLRTARELLSVLYADLA